MTRVVLGATGRLGRMVRHVWGEDQARYVGRDIPDDLPSDGVLIDLRGVVPGRGDVFQASKLAFDALEAAQRAGMSRVFLASTAAVYGAHPGPLTPDVAAPRSDYGHAKLEMERLALAHRQPSTSLRIGNVAGADAILGGWQPGMVLDTCPEGQTPRRSYIGPESLARVLAVLAQRPAACPHILNIAAPGSVGMGELLDAAGLGWRKGPVAPDMIKDVRLDTGPLEQMTEFGPDECTASGIVAQWRACKEAVQL
jgi:uncharacterized protein YbjT (DUF2867 family)